MKTRTNQPIELENTTDIEHLSDEFLDRLKAGDILTKQTGKQKHTYVVSYKEEKHGICITYVACGYMETISYDYTAGHWVFNSKDVIEVPSKSEIKKVKKYIVSGTLTDSNEDTYNFYFYAIATNLTITQDHTGIQGEMLLTEMQIWDHDNVYEYYVLNPQMGWENDIYKAYDLGGDVGKTLAVDSYTINNLSEVEL